MAQVVVRATQPALAAIKLAWWRERLEDLDHGKVPAEPRLQQAARELLPLGISGKKLAELEQSWAALLDEAPDRERIAERGELLFELGAMLLGLQFGESLGKAGRMFATVRVARLGLLEISTGGSGLERQVSPRRARPLTALAALAMRDLRRGGPPFEPEATPGRAWTLLRHRLTGRY